MSLEADTQNQLQLESALFGDSRLMENDALADEIPRAKRGKLVN